MVSTLGLVVLTLGCLSGQGKLGAEPVFRLGKPTYFGTGCPTEKSVQVTTSADRQSFTVQLSQFAAATSGSTTRDRKTCNLLLPLNVMQGMSVAVVQVDYRGHVLVPPASRVPGLSASAVSGPPSSANLQTEYFFAGVRGPLLDRSWTAGTNTAMDLSDSFQLGAMAYSPCGATTTFRINTAVTATKTKPSDEDVVISVNATGLEVSGGMRFYVISQVCNEKGKGDDGNEKGKGEEGNEKGDKDKGNGK